MRHVFTFLNLVFLSISAAGQTTAIPIIGAWRIESMRIGGEEVQDVMYRQMRERVEEGELEGAALQEALAEMEAQYADQKAEMEEGFRGSKMEFHADGTLRINLPGEPPTQGKWWLSDDGKKLYTLEDRHSDSQAVELRIDELTADRLTLTETEKDEEGALTVVFVRRKD